MAIHPTALIDATATLAEGVEVGPWCTVGPNVSLAEGVRLVSHVVVQQDTTVGAGTVIHPSPSSAAIRSTTATRASRCGWRSARTI